MRRPLIVSLLALWSTACSSGSQYCAVPSRDAPETCIEISGLGGFGPAGAVAGLSVTTLCQVIGADPSPGTCPEAGRVGGCADSGSDGVSSVEWSYTGTLDDLSCSSDETAVGPDGSPLADTDVAADGGGTDDTDEAGGSGDDNAPSECSQDLGDPVSVVFTNNLDVVVTLYWVDAGCGERRYATLNAGTTHTQDTTVGHVWIARAGVDDADGDLLWEGAVTEEDAGRSIVME